MKRYFFSFAALFSISVSVIAQGPEWDKIAGQVRNIAKDEKVVQAVADVHAASIALAQTAFRKYAEIAPTQDKQFLQMVVAFLQGLLDDITPVLRNGNKALSDEKKEELTQKLMVAQQMMQALGMSLADYMQQHYSKVSTIKKGRKTVTYPEPDLEKLAPLYMPIVSMMQTTLVSLEQALQA